MTGKREITVPDLKNTREIIRKWRSCQTDRERHRVIKQLEHTHPDIAGRFRNLLEG